jgi:hypothetical protein
MGRFMIEVWSFLRVREKFWLGPVMIPVTVVSALLKATQGYRHSSTKCDSAPVSGEGAQSAKLMRRSSTRSEPWSADRRS